MHMTIHRLYSERNAKMPAITQTRKFSSCWRQASHYDGTHPHLRPRMMHPMHRLQPINRQMRIHLRRRDIRMPQQRLHRAQIRTMLHHMRRQLCRSLCGLACEFNPFTSRHTSCAVNAFPRTEQKQRPLHTMRTAHQLRPSALHIHLQRLHRRPPDRHNPLLIALAPHLHTRAL